jgi:hypothetical protein
MSLYSFHMVCDNFFKIEIAITNKVSVVSMNVQGLGDRAKRRDVNNFLKGKKYMYATRHSFHK